MKSFFVLSLAQILIYVLYILVALVYVSRRAWAWIKNRLSLNTTRTS